MKTRACISLLFALYLTACAPPNPRVATGTIRLVVEDCQGAITDCDQTIALNPVDSLAYHQRGLAYTCQNDYDQAVKFTPQFTMAYRSRSTALK